MGRQEWLGRQRPAQDKELKVVRLDELRPSATTRRFFACSGVVRIKRTAIGDDGQPYTEAIELPVTTERLDAVARDYEKVRKPTMPVKDKLVNPDSELGKALGLSKAEVVSVAQPEDPAYQEALAQYNEGLMWAMVAEAIAVPLYFVDGEDKERQAETTSDKVTALKQIGFTNNALVEVARKIQELREWTDAERARFFGEGSASV